MEDQVSQPHGLGNKLFEYVSKSPIVTLWNLILFLGGIFLLIYFWKINYLPQADLASLSGVFAAAALVGLVLLLTLVVSQMLPGLYFQFAIKPKTNEEEAIARKQFFLGYVLGAIVFCVIILYADKLKFEGWAIALIIASLLGGCWGAWQFKRLNENSAKDPQDQRGEGGSSKWDGYILCFLVWVASLLFAVFPLGLIQHSSFDNIIGALWLFWVVFLNFIFAGLKPNGTARTVKIVLISALCLLLIFMVTPSRISGGIVRSLGLGNISNATLLVTTNACEALDQIDGALCKISEQAGAGLIPQVDIVSRIGGEYLLEFRYPKKCQKSCDTSLDETSRVLRATLKGEDVISYSVDRPAKLEDSSNSTDLDKKNKEPRSTNESFIEPMNSYPHATLSQRNAKESFACRYAKLPCSNQSAIPDQIGQTDAVSAEKPLLPNSVQPIVNNYNIIDGCCACKKSGGTSGKHTEKPCTPSKPDAEK